MWHLETKSKNFVCAKRFPLRMVHSVLWIFLLLALVIPRVTNAADEEAYPLVVLKEKNGQSVNVVVQNNGYAPVSGSVGIGAAFNVRSDVIWPVEFQLPPRTQITLATLRPKVEGQMMTFSPAHSFVIGDRLAKVNQDYPYRLPFKTGTVFDVFADGKGPVVGDVVPHLKKAIPLVPKTREGLPPLYASPFERYSFHFGVPTGKTIVASRPGVVIWDVSSRIYQSNPMDNFSPQLLLQRTNNIGVLHDDGSIGLYMHLLNDSSAVKQGERVVVGQVLGFAGKAAGYPSNYVHFSVLRQTGKGFESIPVGFYDNSGRQIPLSKGERMKVGQARSSPGSGQVIPAKEIEDSLQQKAMNSSNTPVVKQVNIDWLPFVMLGMTILLVLILRKLRARGSRFSDTRQYRPVPTTTHLPRSDDWEEVEPKPVVFTPELLTRIEWRRFEELVAGFLRCKGYETKLNGFRNGGDGGIDIKLFKDSVLVGAVQCKNQRGKVDAEKLRSFLGTRVFQDNHGLEKYYFSTSGFTSGAFYEGWHSKVQMIGGRKLVNEIRNLPLDQQRELLEIATHGAYKVPSCARCGEKMSLQPDRHEWACECGNQRRASSFH